MRNLLDLLLHLIVGQDEFIKKLSGTLVVLSLVLVAGLWSGGFDSPPPQLLVLALAGHLFSAMNGVGLQVLLLFGYRWLAYLDDAADDGLPGEDVHFADNSEERRLLSLEERGQWLEMLKLLLLVLQLASFLFSLLFLSGSLLFTSSMPGTSTASLTTPAPRFASGQSCQRCRPLHATGTWFHSGNGTGVSY